MVNTLKVKDIMLQKEKMKFINIKKEQQEIFNEISKYKWAFGHDEIIQTIYLDEFY